MRWLKKCNYIPFWKRNDPSIQDELGYTKAMDWIIYVKTDVPEYLRHDPLIGNRCGITCTIFWTLYVKTKPPKYF